MSVKMKGCFGDKGNAIYTFSLREKLNKDLSDVVSLKLSINVKDYIFHLLKMLDELDEVSQS